MNEVFDSQQMTVEYKKDDNIVLVVLKGKVLRDDFRTPMMHAADMVLRHSCKILAIDVGAEVKLDAIDINWCKKVLMTNLKKSGLEMLILIDGNKQESIRKCRDYCTDKIKTVICKDYDEARAQTEAAITASEEADRYAAMTREEALEYMGLSSDADIKEIDDRFWQMSKRLRGKDDPESKSKEDEISAIYDIASGRRDRRREEQALEDAEPKKFGRSQTQWRNIFHYYWKTVLLGLIVTVSAVLVIIGIATNSKTDCSVIFFGNMNFDNTVVREALLEQEIRKPYVGYADLVVPNDEDYPDTDYGAQTFDAMLYTEPDVLISDNKSYFYYFDNFRDLTPLYDRIMAGLSEEAKDVVQPVYMTEQDSVRYKNISLLGIGFETDELGDPLQFSDEPVMIGIEITDPELAVKLGVECKWKSRKTTLILGQCSNSKNDDQTVQVITTIINRAVAG